MVIQERSEVLGECAQLCVDMIHVHCSPANLRVRHHAVSTVLQWPISQVRREMRTCICLHMDECDQGNEALQIKTGAGADVLVGGKLLE